MQDKARVVRGFIGLSLVLSLLVLLTGCWWLFNTAPVASFTASALSGTAPLTVNFSAILSYDPDGIITAYEWDFGDGSSGSGESVSHTYTASGTYTVVLRVTDNNSKRTTASKTITVLPAEEPGAGGAGPTASFTATPLVGEAPLTVSFNASASAYAGHAITYYSWNFGDGTTGTGMTTTHTYAPSTTTTYHVVLCVIADDNTEGTATKDITVTVPSAVPPSTAPTASFTAAPNTGTAPVTITFDPSGSTAAAGHTINTYVWNFGDQSFKTETTDTTVTHEYITAQASQNFTVTLTVIDDQNLTDSYSRTVMAKNSQPVAGFEMSTDGATWDVKDVQTSGKTITVWFRSKEPNWTSGTEPYNTAPDNFEQAPYGDGDRDLSYDPEGKTGTGWGINKYTWTFGDGSEPKTYTTFTNVYNGTVSHTFATTSDSQTFTVTLQVTDKLVATGTYTRQVKLGQP